MTKFPGIVGAIAIAVFSGVLALKADNAAGGQTVRPIVVELFTSQGCYSCPPAEAFLGELSARPDIIALELHVDYWDDLVYGAAGKWKDPFSSPMATQRQKLYAQSFGTGRIYTPQMVVDGHLQGVGSNRGAILSAIGQAQKQAEPAVSLQVSRGPSGSLSLEIEGPDKTDAVLWLVTFARTGTTEVLAGENKGKTLVSHNIDKNLTYQE